MSWPGNIVCIFLLAVCLSLAAGCRSPRQIRDPEYASVVRSLGQAARDPEPAASSMPQVVPELAGPHPVEDYIAYALAQQPEIQAARKVVEAKAHRVPQAASLQDPMVGTTFFPEEIQTAAGAQQFSLNASQRLPWFGKLARRADAAEAEVEIARAELVAKELEVIQQVKRAYYELYFVQKAIFITEQDRVLMLRFVRIAEVKNITGGRQADVLRAQVEASNLEADLVRLRQQLDSARARLARVLHIGPETHVQALDQLPYQPVPRDLELLYQRAVSLRPELHAQLAAVMRDRRKVDLARLDYYPDATLAATWIDTGDHGVSRVANGRDPLLLGVNVNIPLYRKRLDSAVREAEAQVVASARRYDSLRDRTVEEITDLFAQATSQRELVEIFAGDIVPKADLTVRESERAYEANIIDFLTLVDNWRQLLRFQITLHRLEAQLRQTLATLERTVGGGGSLAPAGDRIPLPTQPAPESFPPPAIQLQTP